MKITQYLFLAALAASSLFAQTATLRGQVADESGAVVPGATVTLSGSAGAGSGHDNGRERFSYSFTGVPLGNYSVQASAPQLTQTQASKVSLKPGPQVVNLVLKVRIDGGEGDGF